MTTHLTEDELVAWRNNADAQDDGLTGHLAECAMCAAAYESLLRTPRITELILTDELTPIDGQIALVRDDSALYFKPAVSMASVYSAIKDPRTAAKPFGPYAWRAWASLAGIVAAGLALLFFLMPAPQSATALTQSRGTIEVLEAGTGDLRSRIQWRSTVSDATQYQVLLKDDASRVVFNVVTSARQAGLPEEIVRRLQPERIYTWTVTALSPSGEPLVSRSRTFSVPGMPR